MDHPVNGAEQAFEIVREPEPAATDCMQIVVRCGEKTNPGHAGHQRFQLVEGRGGVNGRGEHLDAVPGVDIDAATYAIGTRPAGPVFARGSGEGYITPLLGT